MHVSECVKGAGPRVGTRPGAGTGPGECDLTLIGRSVRQPGMAIRELNSQYPGGGGTEPDHTAISICIASAPARAALSIIRQGLHGGRPSLLA